MDNGFWKMKKFQRADNMIYAFPIQLFLLEEMRERRYDHYARVIQKAFCRYFARRQRQKQREQAAGIIIPSFLFLTILFLKDH